jgi:hypothetical protein
VVVFRRSNRYPFLQAQKNKLYLSGYHTTRLRFELGTARMKSVLTPTSLITHLAVLVLDEGKDVPLLKHHAMKVYGAVEL